MSFFSKLFGKKSSSGGVKYPLDWIELDIHNHLLPGIDDGSKSVEESILLIKGMKEVGIKRAIATPHIMANMYPNTKETIKSAYDKLYTQLKDKNIEFEIGFAAEHMIDDELTDIIEKDKLCLLPNNHVLIEMSYLQESQNLFLIIRDLQEKGLQPILAHPERYNYYHQNFKMFETIKNSGCMLQLNLLSITRYYGEHVKAVALSLIKSGMYDFVGTDLHHEKHLAGLRHLTQKYNTKELLKNNPIKNKYLLGKQPMRVLINAS